MSSARVSGVAFHYDANDNAVVELSSISSSTDASSSFASAKKNHVKYVDADRRDPFELRQYWCRWPMFWFNHTTNLTTARLIALQVVAISIAAVIFRNYRWMYYITLALFADFTLRAFFCGRGSLLGTIANIVSFYLPRNYAPSPPKQFSSFIGALFSGVSALIFFVGDGHRSSQASAVLMGCLAGAAFFEAFFDFCFGCVFFRLLVQAGLFDSNYAYSFQQVTDENERSTHDHELNYDYQTVKRITKQRQDSQSGRTVQYSYKPSTDASKRAQFNLIKKVRISYFLFPMMLALLAVSWKIHATSSVFNGSVLPYYIISIAAGSVWALLTLLFIARLFIHPYKVMREWNHPINRNLFSSWSISLLLFSYIAVGHEDGFAEVIFWIAGPMQLFFSITAMSAWISEQSSAMTFNPSWMLPAIGNTIASIVMPMIKQRFYEVAWLWFGISVFMWIVIITMSFNRLSLFNKLQHHLRPYLFFYMAAPALISSSWSFIANPEQPILDGFGRSTYYIAVVFSMLFFYLGFFRNYFGRKSFDIHYLASGFSLNALAISSQIYHIHVQTDVSFGICAFYMLIANTVNAIQTAHVILLFTSKKMFSGEIKTYPLSYYKLSSFAVMTIINKLIESSRNNDIQSVQSLWLELSSLLKQQNKEKSTIIYPVYNTIIPSVTKDADIELQQEINMINDVEVAVSRAASGDKASMDNLSTILSSLLQQQQQQSSYDEQHLSFVYRKYLSTEQQQELLKQVWSSSTYQQWSTSLPLLVKYQPYHQLRVDLLEQLQLALSNEFTTVINTILYESVDELTWNRIVADYPSTLPPRSTNRFTRIY